MTEEKNGAILIPIILQCGLCKISHTMYAPLGHGVYGRAWEAGELTGDLMMPNLNRLDLQGWKVEHHEKRGSLPFLSQPNSFISKRWTEVTCPSCIPDRDNMKVVEKP